VAGGAPEHCAGAAGPRARAARFDLIHIVDSGPSLREGTLLSLLSRTPLVVHFHRHSQTVGPKKRIVLKTVASVAGAIVGVSKFVRIGIEQYMVSGRAP